MELEVKSFRFLLLLQCFASGANQRRPAWFSPRTAPARIRIRSSIFRRRFATRARYDLWR